MLSNLKVTLKKKKSLLLLFYIEGENIREGMVKKKSSGGGELSRFQIWHCKPLNFTVEKRVYSDFEALAED